VALLTEGVGDEEEKLFGPVQENVVPPLAFRLSVAPEQIGELLPTTGTGLGYTVTLTELV
jgi:hypothetical protein